MAKITGKCLICGKNKELSSDNNDFITGFGICKTCVNNMADFNDENSIRQICRYLNIPFVKSLFNEVNKMKKPRWADYTRRINLKQNLNVYDDSDFNEEKKTTEDFVVTNEMRIKWGTGYSNKQIEELEYSLQSLYAIKEPQTEVEKQRYYMNCQLKLTLNEAYRMGDVKVIPNLRKAYEDDSKAIGLESVLNTKEDDVESIGERIRGWERTKPVPVHEDLDDVNNIKDYLRKWFRIPLKRDFGLASEQEVAELYEDE